VADTEYLVKLKKKGVGACNMWRLVNAHVRLNLTGADLAGADLAGADLSKADLSKADLSNANLRPTS
jgi:uncharacterized protein YjbI with pentapeptide repeats